MHISVTVDDITVDATGENPTTVTISHGASTIVWEFKKRHVAEDVVHMLFRQLRRGEALPGSRFEAMMRATSVNNVAAEMYWDLEELVTRHQGTIQAIDPLNGPNGMHARFDIRLPLNEDQQ